MLNVSDNIPILLIPSGILISVSKVHPENASLSMLAIPLGIIVEAQPMTNLLVSLSIIALQLLRESYTGLSSTTTILFNDAQPVNARQEILVRLLGITMLSSAGQLIGGALIGGIIASFSGILGYKVSLILAAIVALIAFLFTLRLKSRDEQIATMKANQ